MFNSAPAHTKVVVSLNFGGPRLDWRAHSSLQKDRQASACVRGYRGPATRLQEGAGGINPFVPRDHERGKRQRPFAARSLVTFARAQKHTHCIAG